MSDTGITINDDLKDFELIREYDSALTDNFARAYMGKKITKAEWRKANKCRIFLQIFTVGDIATADGMTIEENILKGIYQGSRARNIEWPYQQRPKPSDWTCWRRVLRKSIINNTGNLRISLGRWIQSTERTYKKKWEWWLNHENDLLYRQKDNVWEVFNPLTQRRRRRNTQRVYRQYTVSEEPQMNLLSRTSVIYNKGVYISLGYNTQIIPCDPFPHEQQQQAQLVNERRDNMESDEDILAKVINALDIREGEQWALKEILTTESITEIVRDIENGTAVAVSDGSYKDNGGTAAWIIENKSGTQRIVGQVNVPGTVSDQSAYRSEIAGIYGSILVIETIKDALGLEKGGIMIVCDGKNALEQALNTEYNITSCQQQHFDLLSGIQGYIRDSCIQYTAKHIKGHQDDTKELNELDRLSVLNVEADLYAKYYWDERYGDKEKMPMYCKYVIPKGMWEISLMGNRICKDLFEYLREGIQAKNALEYWVKRKKRFTYSSFLEVDWDANKRAFKSVSITRRHWVTKFEAGICGTGRMMKLWKQRVIDNCPKCREPNETTTHVLQCKSEATNAIWEKSLESLEGWLRENNTCPDIKRLLLQILNQWRLGQVVQNITDIEFESCEGVFRAQKEIGWRQLMGGCLSFEWAKAQEDYFKWIGIRRTGERWVTELIKKLWDIAWDLWEDRNKALHNTSMEAILSGVASLDKAINEEYQLGSAGLPKAVRDNFPDDIEEVLKAPLIQKKSWFTLVRAARELIHDERIQDEFTDPRSYLRKWVGLQYGK
jgi:hypothetical protein